MTFIELLLRHASVISKFYFYTDIDLGLRKSTEHCSLD